MTRVASARPSVGELEVAVALDGEQAVALHPGHGLGDGRAPGAEPLGDPGAQRHDALLLELVDGPEVHLGGVDQVASRVIAYCHLCPDDHRVWLRRDPAVWRDHPALVDGRTRRRRRAVLPLFVLDPALWAPAGPARRAYLAARCARSRLSEQYDGALVVRHGTPAPRCCPGWPARSARAGSTSRRVHAVTAGAATTGSRAGPGRARLELVRTGSPYAVAPGRVTNRRRRRRTRSSPRSRRAWRDARLARSGGAPDAAAPALGPPRPTPRTCPRPRDGVPEPADGGRGRPRCGAGTSSSTRASSDYAERRDRPDLDGTSDALGAPEVGRDPPAHAAGRPARAAAARGQRRPVRDELAWREFYADVLCAPARTPPATTSRPELADDGVRRPAGDRSCRGVAARAAPASRSSTPGCASCRPTGWMHNRVRMIVASFLVKDLHVEWQHGRPALHAVPGRRRPRLQPARLAVGAGCGTDAAPYFRVFNPVTQGRKFDPDGDYVRRWVPELAHLAGAAAHEPWTGDRRLRARLPRADRRPRHEREVALERYAAARD